MPGNKHSLPNLRPWMIVLVISLVYVSIVLAISGGDPLVFTTLPEPPSPSNPDGDPGYDGQFTYLIAVDPASAVQHLDAPAYRMQRILLPMLARLLAMGQRALIPWTLLLINITALIGGTYLLEELLDAEGVSHWYALAYGLFAGVLAPVRLSLTEPLAYGLVLAAIWLERKSHLRWAPAALALAGLTKEPTLIFAAGYALWLGAERRWREGILLAVGAGGPFVVWQGVLYFWIGSFGIGSGGAGGTPFEIIPYMGFFRIYTETGNLLVFVIFAVLMLPLAIVPSVWGLVRSIRDMLRHAWHPYVFLLLVNGALIAITPFSTFREPLGMLRFLPGLVISMLLYSAHFKQVRMQIYTLLWLTSFAVIVISG